MPKDRKKYSGQAWSRQTYKPGQPNETKSGKDKESLAELQVWQCLQKLNAAAAQMKREPAFGQKTMVSQEQSFSRDKHSQLARIESKRAFQKESTRLVRTYMPLVRQIAFRYAQFNPSALDDLMQVGSIGLIKAIRYYDPKRPGSASFKTLAACYVRGEIRHYLRDHHSLIQVPRRLTQVTAKLSQLEEKLTRLLDHTPSVKELADYAGLSQEEVLEAQRSWEARLHYESLDGGNNDEDGEDRRSLSELVPDRKDQDREHRREQREQITQALQRLADKNRRILEFVFLYDLTQKETASLLGLSEMGVSRGLHNGLKQLRAIMAADIGSSPS